MLSDKASLDARVGWIKQEIEQQLNKVGGYLNKVTENTTAFDVDALEQCKDTLSDITNTMKMTGVQGGEHLAIEMHALVEGLIAGEISDKKTSIVMLQKGIVQITEYLQHLEDGYADLPIVVLPLLNELRAARGAELLSEVLVFLPEEGAVGNSHIGTEEFISIPDEVRQKVYHRLRGHFQQALLAWFKGNDVNKSLVKIEVLSNDLLRIHETVSVRILWWLSKALAQGLREKKLEHGVAVKLIMGNIERLIQTFSETDKDELDSLVGIDDIKKNLLYYIGIAENGATEIDAVKEAFLLDVYLPQGETLEKLRKHYASPGQKLWRSVADGVNEDIESIMEGFQSMELNPDEGIIQLIIDKSRTTSTTLSMLGLGKLAKIIDKQVDEFEIFKKNPRNFKKERMLEVATEWLRVEDVLKEYTETGEDVTRKLFANQDDAIGADDPQYLVSDYSARKKVLGIVENKLSSIIESLDEYAKDNELSYLEAANRSMATVDNTVKFLGNEEVYPLTEGALFYMNKYVQGDNGFPETEQLDLLADAVASLENSITALSNNGEHLTSLNPGYMSILKLHELCGLHEGIENQISNMESENQISKKLHRQKKMELILTD